METHASRKDTTWVIVVTNICTKMNTAIHRLRLHIKLTIRRKEENVFVN